MITKIAFNLTTLSLFFFSIGHLTSPAFLRYFNVLLILPMIYFTLKDIGILKKNLSIIFLIAFTFIATLSLCINFEFLEIPKKSFENLRYYILGFLAIAPLTYWIKNSKIKTKRILLSLYFISIIVSSLRAFYLYSLGANRTGGYLHIMTYGYGLAMVIPLLICGILNRKKIGEYINVKLCISSIPFAFIGLALTQARGAILGLVVSLPILIKSFYPRLTKVYLTIIGIFFAIILVNYFFPQNLDVRNRMFMSYNNDSDSLRRTLWESAWIATKEKPILGWGLQNQYTQLERILLENGLTTHGEKFTHSHNFLLETASGTGIVGVILFLGWLICWIKEIIQSKNELMKLFLIPFITVIAISGQFEFFITETNGRMIFLVYAFSQAIMITTKQKDSQ